MKGRSLIPARIRRAPGPRSSMILGCSLTNRSREARGRAPPPRPARGSAPRRTKANAWVRSRRVGLALRSGGERLASARRGGLASGPASAGDWLPRASGGLASLAAGDQASLGVQGPGRCARVGRRRRAPGAGEPLVPHEDERGRTKGVRPGLLSAAGAGVSVGSGYRERPGADRRVGEPGIESETLNPARRRRRRRGRRRIRRRIARRSRRSPLRSGPGGSSGRR